MGVVALGEICVIVVVAAVAMLVDVLVSCTGMVAVAVVAVDDRSLVVDDTLVVLTSLRHTSGSKSNVTKGL